MSIEDEGDGGHKHGNGCCDGKHDHDHSHKHDHDEGHGDNKGRSSGFSRRGFMGAAGLTAAGLGFNALAPSGAEAAHFKAEASQWQHYVESHPIGRVGTPEDIVHLAVYLASDESSWVTGSIFTIDGGRTAM